MPRKARVKQWRVMHKNGSGREVDGLPADARLVFDNGDVKVYDRGKPGKLEVSQAFQLDLPGIVQNLIVFRSVFYPASVEPEGAVDLESLRQIVWHCRKGVMFDVSAVEDEDGGDGDDEDDEEIAEEETEELEGSDVESSSSYDEDEQDEEDDEEDEEEDEEDDDEEEEEEDDEETGVGVNNDDDDYVEESD